MVRGGGWPPDTSPGGLLKIRFLSRGLCWPVVHVFNEHQPHNNFALPCPLLWWTETVLCVDRSWPKTATTKTKAQSVSIWRECHRCPRWARGWPAVISCSVPGICVQETISCLFDLCDFCSSGILVKHVWICLKLNVVTILIDSILSRYSKVYGGVLTVEKLKWSFLLYFW